MIFFDYSSATKEIYTLSLHDALPILFTKLSYDTLGDFAGVSRIANVPSILVVSPSLGVKSVNELVALRSEEHTSELQSRFDLVCRLLLEKKKSRTRLIDADSVVHD